MLTAPLERISKREQLISADPICGNNIGHGRLAARYRAGLVERDYPGLAGIFERNCCLKQNSVLCADTVSDHYRDRSRKSERARTADDKHRDSACKRISERLSRKEPCGDSHRRYRYNGGNEHAGHLVRYLCDRRLGRRRVADHRDYLRKRSVLADPASLAADKAGAVQRSRRNGAALRFVHRNALAGKRRFIHRAAAAEHNAVHRDALTGTNDKYISPRHLGYRDGDLLAFPLDRCSLRRKLHQPAQRIGSPAL